MRLAWRLFKKACGVLALIVCGLLIAAVALVWRPEWFLTPTVLAKAVKTFGRAYHPEWRSFELRLASRSFLSKDVSLQADDFCFSSSSDAVKGCLTRADVRLSARLSRHGVALERVGRLNLAGRGLTIDLPRLPPSPAKKPKARRDLSQGLAGLVPRPIRGARLGELDVRLTDSRLTLRSSATVSGDLTLSYSTGMALAAALRYDARGKHETLSAHMLLDSDVLTRGELTYLAATGRLVGDKSDAASFDARVSQPRADTLALTAVLGLENGPRRLRSRIAGTASPSAYRAKVSAALSDPSGPVRELALRSCRIVAPRSNGALAAVSLDCALSAEPRPFGATAGSQLKKIDAVLSASGKKGRGDAFKGQLALTVTPREDWYRFGAELTADFRGRLGDLPASLKARHKLVASVDVDQFQDLVKYLDGTAYAVPAPLHALRGPLDFKLQSEGDPRDPDQTVTYRLNSKLTSGRQKVTARVDGSLVAKDLLTPRRSFSDTTEVALEQVALELPYMKLGAMPAVTVDPRIATGEESEEARERIERKQQETLASGRVARSSAPAVDYVARIRTGKPLLLYTNLNPNPIPITLRLTAAPQGIEGRIVVEPFDAELFKRRGSVEHVTLAMTPGTKAMDLDGLVRFKMNETDVQLKLLGTTEKPKVVFESEPPMKQEDIIALLLFGKSPDDLDPDQNATVSNSQSAMASGAFGLASLYLFASTPIQYVGYDPATQTYAIKFSLPGGASLEVGSGADESHLTVRKRLARQWVIQTELERSQSSLQGQEQSRSAVTTFLEWFQRY